MIHHCDLHPTTHESLLLPGWLKTGVETGLASNLELVTQVDTRGEVQRQQPLFTDPFPPIPGRTAPAGAAGGGLDLDVRLRRRRFRNIKVGDHGRAVWRPLPRLAIIFR